MKLEHIPTVGPDTFLGSYLAAWKYFFQGHKLIEEGYHRVRISSWFGSVIRLNSLHLQYPGQVFKLSTFETRNRWLIVGAGPHFADDIRRAGDDQLCHEEPAFELLQTDYTLADMRNRDATHFLATLKGPMTKNVDARFADLQDEISVSINEFIPPSEGMYIPVLLVPRSLADSVYRLDELPSD